MTADLLSRLEALTGPDREVDGAIYCAVGHRMIAECWPHWTAAQRDLATPHYTASLDAALTLVPAGWQWQVSNRAPPPHAGRAFLDNKAHPFVGIGAARNPELIRIENTAATPVIALCIAALRARAKG